MGRLYTYSELKESRLIYDRKPPMFGIVMTALSLAFVVGVLLWAGLSTKTYVVRATGVVTASNKINIMNYASGAIESIEVSEGETVTEGDTLLVIDSFQAELQIEQVRSVVKLYQDKIECLSRLISFVNDYSLNDANTHANPFDKNNIDTAKEYSDAEYFIAYVESSVEQAEGSDREFTQAELDNMKTAYLTQQSVYSSLDQNIAEKARQESQLKMYEDSLVEYTIKAAGSGVVHFNSGLTIGTVLQSGTLLGNISSAASDDLYFSLAVSATERSKLSVGTSTEIAVSGAMQTEFGTLEGVVAAIDSDSTQTDDGQVYYIVKIKPSAAELSDKSGRTVELKPGMIGECRIKYAETTYLKWAVEQIVGKLR
ncbi:MAG: HlyD family secretion protein [Roseburia sp.]|nr:HlyD family secretion protein [Roseburia sp.]